MNRFFSNFILGFFIGFLPIVLWAGAFEDAFGASARVQAMGGAGVALSEDASAIFYNPALLARCPKQMISLGYHFIRTDLNVKDANQQQLYGKQFGFSQFGNFGACLFPLKKIAFGFYASFPLQLPIKLPNIETVDSAPQFLMYGNRIALPNVLVGFAYAPTEQLSLGLTASLSAGVSINQTMQVTEFGSVISPQIYPLISMIVGLSGQLTDKLSLSLLYRQDSYGQFNVDVETKIDTLYFIYGTLPLLLSYQIGYSPEQFALGFSYRPTSAWILGMDVTYYRWSKVSSLFMSAKAKGKSWISDKIVFPIEESQNLNDTLVPRIGLEYLFNEKASMRLGYAFRLSYIPTPTGKANLLDQHVHRFTVGTGYRFIFNENFALGLDAFVATDWMVQNKVTKDSNQPEPRNYTFGGMALNGGINLNAEY